DVEAPARAVRRHDRCGARQGRTCGGVAVVDGQALAVHGYVGQLTWRAVRGLPCDLAQSLEVPPRHQNGTSSAGVTDCRRSSSASATCLARGPISPTGPTHDGHPRSHVHEAMSVVVCVSSVSCMRKRGALKPMPPGYASYRYTCASAVPVTGGAAIPAVASPL